MSEPCFARRDHSFCGPPCLVSPIVVLVPTCPCELCSIISASAVGHPVPNEHPLPRVAHAWTR
eukprot:6430774-Alexandrium_andersonii.AAC.1